MLYTLLLILHTIVVISLVGIILVQRGRSGGLIEALGGVESIFGTKTSALLVKITVALSVLFFLTSISLAYLSKQRGKPLVDQYEGIMTKSAPGVVTQQPQAPVQEGQKPFQEQQPSVDEGE